MFDSQGVGDRIKVLREELGLNQTELAAELDVHQTKISQTESGKRKPSFEVLFFLSENCSVTIDYILKGSDSFEPCMASAMNVSAQTESAKEALQHLNKCARSIKKLDAEAYPAIVALEREVAMHQDPELIKCLNYFETSTVGHI